MSAPSVIPTPVTWPSLTEFPGEMIREWQQFFARKGHFPAARKYDGRTSPALVNALDLYQRSIGITPSKPPLVDQQTLEAALRDPEWPRVWLKPDLQAPEPGPSDPQPDMRHLRPYYMVPLLETAFAGEHALLVSEIKKDVEDRLSKGREVTDVFILSHGWHRNYFSGVAAYDRIVSRLGILRARGRLIPKDPEFEPLFVGLHWNSDPGEDSWEDKSGRRNKESFIDNCRSLFELPPTVTENREGKFLTDFEDIFELLSCLSTPGTEVGDKDIAETSRRLTGELKGYWIKGMDPLYHARLQAQGADASADILPYKVATVWRCYFEAQNKTFLLDQQERAEPVGSPLTAVFTLLKFLFGIGVISVAGLIPGINKLWDSAWFKANILEPLRSIWEGYASLVLGVIDPNPGATEAWRVLLAIVTVALLCSATLYILGVSRSETDESKGSKGFPLLPALTWLPLQIILTMPLLMVLFSTWILRTPLILAGLMCFLVPNNTWSVPWVTVGVVLVVISVLIAVSEYASGKSISWIFQERLKRRSDRSLTLRDHLAALARWPINMVKCAVGRDSQLHNLASSIDNQFAFFELQRKGVDAGQDAGKFIRAMLSEVEELRGTRIHLAAHSFGGLVILNALRDLLGVTLPVRPSKKPFTPNARREWKVRRLKSHFSVRNVANAFLSQPSRGALKTNGDAPAPVQDDGFRCTLKSVTLIQAAVASEWFTGEDQVVNSVDTIASVYSGYDSANGFWYPLANNGRKAAGYVGICNVPLNGKLTTPAPPLGQEGVYAMLVKPPDLPIRNPKWFNIDASRLIYAGPVATGGGHSDIFKDDVVNLLWAVTQA